MFQQHFPSLRSEISAVAPILYTCIIMYLGIISSLRSILTFNARQQRPDVKDLLDGDHSYLRGNIATRGPCPGLNALANQGYLYVMQQH